MRTRPGSPPGWPGEEVTVVALTGLQEKTESLAGEHHVPGVAVGILCDGEEHLT